MSQITIKDIARALNLSNSTVSRALKSSYQISEATQKLVKDYAEKHHYRPNVVAQSLKNRRSKSIGVLFPSVANSFFSEVMNGIESIASKSNYQVFIVQTHESLDREKESIEQLRLRLVDGLLISIATETTEASHVQQLVNEGFPVVLFDRTIQGVACSAVVSDNRAGSYQATLHLLQQGFRRIAHITSGPGMVITLERLQGYYQALAAFNLQPNGQLVRYCNYGGMMDAEVEAAIHQLMELPNPPDAIVTASDRITIKSFAVLKKLGIAIPAQVGFVGLSNFSAPELFYPPLTTIRQAAFEMGKAAVELLLRQVDAHQKNRKVDVSTIVLPTELIVRESSVRSQQPLPGVR